MGAFLNRRCNWTFIPGRLHIVDTKRNHIKLLEHKPARITHQKRLQIAFFHQPLKLAFRIFQDIFDQKIELKSCLKQVEVYKSGHRLAGGDVRPQPDSCFSTTAWLADVHQRFCFSARPGSLLYVASDSAKSVLITSGSGQVTDTVRHHHFFHNDHHCIAYESMKVSLSGLTSARWLTNEGQIAFWSNLNLS